MATRKAKARKTTARPADEKAVAAAARLVRRAKREEATALRSAKSRAAGAPPARLSSIGIVSDADQRKVRAFLDQLSGDAEQVKHTRVVLRKLKKILMAFDHVRQHPAIDC